MTCKRIRGLIVYLDGVDIREAERRNYKVIDDLNLIPGVRVEDSFFSYVTRQKGGKIECKVLAINGNLNEQAIRSIIKKYGRVEFD